MSAIPLDWDNNIHKLWLTDNKLDAVQAVLAKVNRCGENKPKGLLMQAGFYFYFLKDYSACIAILNHALVSYPGDTNILPTLIVALSRAGQYEQARNYGEEYVAKYPNNYAVWDSLANIYYQLNMENEATNAGTTSLRLKDTAAKACDPSWRLPNTSASVYCDNKKKVISYSLWGESPRYLYGALRNVLLAPDIYPGWELWFYVDSSVPTGFIKMIEGLGARVIQKNDNASERDKLCWRFEVCNNPNVGYFLVRDADSVISIRERSGVEAWLQSGQWFHVIRDWWTHTDLMLAGLWGGVAGVLPDMATLLKGYTVNAVETPNVDQWFLRDCVWSYVKTSCLVHDRYFKHANAQPLPAYLPHNNFHVGCCEHTQRADYQKQLLKPWLSAIASLK